MNHKRARKGNKKNKQRVISVEAKTPNQKEYIKSIIENDVVFCSGPSGSGKSFVAAGIAASHLHRGIIDQIIITRPLVCTGKDIGSLPGELDEKIAPYLLPMQENLKYFLTQSFYGFYSNGGHIQYKPLEIMRGLTFNNSYMILDEAQNCTVDQIKMFITRMGKDSKVLINGDIKQDDLRGRSGLDHCMNRLEDVQGVGICRLGYEDIQRNGIIGKILNALEV
jgi:phosphate starvation-inducible PhoH-like protein